MVVYTEKVFYDAQRQPFTMFRAGTPGKNVWHEQASGATVLAQLARLFELGNNLENILAYCSRMSKTRQILELESSYEL